MVKNLFGSLLHPLPLNPAILPNGEQLNVKINFQQIVLILKLKQFLQRLVHEWGGGGRVIGYEDRSPLTVIQPKLKQGFVVSGFKIKSLRVVKQKSFS